MIGLRKGIVALAGAGIMTFAAGCGGTPPPCQTDLAAVDSARKAAAEAEAKLAAAERERQQLEEAIAAETARKAELEARKAELEAKIAEYSK